MDEGEFQRDLVRELQKDAEDRMIRGMDVVKVIPKNAAVEITTLQRARNTLEQQRVRVSELFYSF